MSQYGPRINGGPIRWARLCIFNGPDGDIPDGSYSCSLPPHGNRHRPERTVLRKNDASTPVILTYAFGNGPTMVDGTSLETLVHHRFSLSRDACPYEQRYGIGQDYLNGVYGFDALGRSVQFPCPIGFSPELDVTCSTHGLDTISVSWQPLAGGDYSYVVIVSREPLSSGKGNPPGVLTGLWSNVDLRAADWRRPETIQQLFAGAERGSSVTVPQGPFGNGASVRVIAFDHRAWRIDRTPPIGSFTLNLSVAEAHVAIPGASAQEQPWTPLQRAARSCAQADALRLLADGADVRVRDISYVTPLHEAARCGSQELVEGLLSGGAPVNSLDRELRTPLHHALTVVHEPQPRIDDFGPGPRAPSPPPKRLYDTAKAQVATLLIGRGADVNARDARGRSVLDYARDFQDAGVLSLLASKGAR